MRELMVDLDAHLPVPLDSLRSSIRAYYEAQLRDLAREEDCRRRAAERGAPRSNETFPRRFILDLKSRVLLDAPLRARDRH